MADRSPHWVPASLASHIEQVDPGESLLRLSAPSLDSIQFGEVPEGWRIEVDRVGHRAVSIGCDRPGTGVCWVLSAVGHRTITLAAGVHDVRIGSHRGGGVNLRLSTADTLLTLCSGTYQVDGTKEDPPIPYRVQTKAYPSHRVILSGNAALKGLTGSGDVDLRMPVRDADLAVSGSLTARHLDQVRVRLERPAVSTGASGPQAPDLTIHQVAAECDIAGPWNAVRLAEVRAGLRLRGAQSLTIEGVCAGRVDVQANSVSMASLNGGGIVRSSEFAATGDVIAVDDVLTVVASRTLSVHTVARGAALLCVGGADSRVDIGASPSKMKLTVTAAEVTERTMSLGTVSPKRLSSVQLDRCLLASTGDAQVFGSVESSMLRIGGRLAIAGRFDCRNLNADPILRGVAAELKQHLGDLSQNRPCLAGELLVATDVLLDGDQKVAVASLFSAEVLSGGSVTVSESCGTFVTKRVHSADVTAGWLGVEEDPTAAVLTASRLMHVMGAVPRGNTLALNGAGVFGGRVEPVLVWRPDGPQTCDLSAGGADRVTVRSSARTETPRLKVPSGKAMQQLCLEGTLVLDIVGADHASSMPVVCQTMTLGAGAKLHVGTAGDDGIDLGLVQLTAEAAQVSTAGGLVVLRPRRARNSRDSCELSIVAGGWVTIGDPETEGVRGVTNGTLPAIRIIGGRGTVSFRTQLASVLCQRDDVGQVPRLLVRDDGLINDLCGPFLLRALGGRILSRPAVIGLAEGVGRRTATLLWRITDGRPRRLHPRGSAGTAAQYLGLDTEKDHVDPLAGGQLIGVDITNVPYSDLPALSGLHVLDPDSEAVMDHACEQADNPQERAQRLKLIAEIVAARANSGATRSAVLWAAARAHHAAVNRNHRVERLVRRIHRLMGYGYRPLPAAITYAAWLLGLAAFLTWVEPHPACATSGAGEPAEFIEGPYTYWQQLVRVLLLPVSLLRLDVGGATAYAPIGCHAGWHTFAFAVTGMVLGFLLVAIRNYLRTPAEH